jgi:AcrR family transcriptional regulator
VGERLTPERPLRRDAASNRDRVLAAAAATMLREGQSVSLARIAEAAGVGSATLYRRFADREALLDALEVRSYAILTEVLDAVLAAGGSGVAMAERFLLGSFANRAELVLPLHGAPWSTTESVRAGREDVRQRVSRIVDAGHEDGTIRGDVDGRTIVEFGALLVQGLPGVPTWERSADQQRRVFLRGISG